MTSNRLDSISGRNIADGVSEGTPQMNADGSGRYGAVAPEAPTRGYQTPGANGDDYVPQNAETGADKVAGVASVVADEAGAVKDTAVAKASAVTDAALDRGADVAAVAKEEIARVAGDALSQFQGLWAQASDQLREQAGASKQQLAELLNSLSTELGEMASKSEQDGPLTALAKQGAYRGGQLSHWLTDAEPSAVLTEVRRFARRRPFTFLAGAALAGVVVGRLSRGLMTSATPTPPAVPAAAPGQIGYEASAPVAFEGERVFPDVSSR